MVLEISVVLENSFHTAVTTLALKTSLARCPVATVLQPVPFQRCCDRCRWCQMPLVLVTAWHHSQPSHWLTALRTLMTSTSAWIIHVVTESLSLLKMWSFYRGISLYVYIVPAKNNNKPNQNNSIYFYWPSTTVLVGSFFFLLENWTVQFSWFVVRGDHTCSDEFVT